MKRRVHEVLAAGQGGDRLSKGVDAALMLLIVANVAAIIVATDGSFPDDATRVLLYFELVSFSIFAVEYVLRVWSCTADPAYAHPVFGRARFVFRP